MRMDGNCAVKSWGLAAVLGLLAFLLLMEQGFGAAVFLGLLAFVLLGVLFNWLFCAPLPQPAPREAASLAGASAAAPAAPAPASSAAATGSASAAAQASGGAASAAGASGAASESGASGSDAAAAGAGGADASGADAASDTAEQATGADDETQPDASEDTDAKGADTAAVAGQVGSLVKPSTPLAGEAELASRKGTWKYSKDDAGSASSGAATSGGAGGAGADVAMASASGDDAGATSAPEKAVAEEGAESGTVTGTAAATIKPSKALAGEAELSARKGSWTYSKDGAQPGSGAAAPSGDASTGAAAETGEAARVDDDKDGTVEGSDEGQKPVLLDAPRGGQADNLKEIKGIGPKLEKLCHSLGVYHFDQIAAWTPAEVAWADANMVGFRGRVTRDNWVEQAKILASGGETEFSKRVEKGGVYD